MKIGTMMIMTAVTLALGTGQVFAQSPAEEREVEEARRQLEEARREMQEAARRFAELSAERAGQVMREIRVERIMAPSVRLGITLSEDGDHSEGILVGEVTEDGPAAKAGLRSGDLVLSIDGKSLAAGEGRAERPLLRVRNALADAKPGDTVKLRYRRGRASREATVTVDQHPERRAFAFAFGDGEPRMVMPQIPGMMLQVRQFGRLELVKVSEGLGRYFGTEDGLLVVRAGEDNLFALQDGDVILSIDGRVPESPVHAMRILRSYAPGETVRMDIIRERQRRTLEATIPERERISLLH